MSLLRGNLLVRRLGLNDFFGCRYFGNPFFRDCFMGNLRRLCWCYGFITVGPEFFYLNSTCFRLFHRFVNDTPPDNRVSDSFLYQVMWFVGAQQPLHSFHITVFKRTLMGFNFDTETSQMCDEIFTLDSQLFGQLMNSFLGHS